MHKTKLWKIIYQSVNSGFLWMVKLQVIFSFNLYCLPSCDPSFLYSMTVYNFLCKKSLEKKQLKNFFKSQFLMPGWRGKQEPWSPLCVPSWSLRVTRLLGKFWARSPRTSHPGREKAVPTWHYSELGGSEWLGGHKTPTRHSGKGQQVASQTEQMKNTENVPNGVLLKFGQKCSRVSIESAFPSRSLSLNYKVSSEAGSCSTRGPRIFLGEQT